MNEKIEDLRHHLFATLQDLRDPAKPMDIERAKAVAQVAQVIVDSAKVENEHIKITGATGTGFVQQQPALPKPGEPRLVKGVR